MSFAQMARYIFFLTLSQSELEVSPQTGLSIPSHYLDCVVRRRIEAKSVTTLSARMANPNEFQTRLSAIFAEAKAQGLQPSKILPEEVQGHFANMKGLSNAKQKIHEMEGYIKDMDESDNSKNERIKALTKQLHDERAAAKELSTDHEGLPADLKQANANVEFYKGLYGREQNEADKYKKKWEDVAAKLSLTNDMSDRVKQHEKEISDLQKIVKKHVDELTSNYSLYENLQEKNSDALMAKEEKILDIEFALLDTEEQCAKLRNENQAITKSHQAIQQLRESEVFMASRTIEESTQTLERNNTLRMAAVSELQALDRLFEQCAMIVGAHQDFIRQLFNNKRDLKFDTETVEKSLKLASGALEGFRSLRESFDRENIERDDARENCTALERSAKFMHDSLHTTSADVKTFLNQLEKQPDKLTMIRYKFFKGKL